MTDAAPPSDLAWRLGRASSATLGVVLIAWALTVPYQSATAGFFGDASTYYSLAHSLADDFDFEYRREDLTRVWHEFPTGPEGIFLKRGRDVQGITVTGSFPFVQLVTGDDGDRERLFYAKAFIYPLVAAPFVWLFGTNGFLVLHAILMTICFLCAYGFLVARSSPVASLVFAAAFLFLSVTPVYMVWLTPEFFNFAIVLIAYFFWAYKETAAESTTTCIGPWRARWLMGPRSDVVAAVLLGVAIYSKPTLGLLIVPIVALAAMRRQWGRAVMAGGVCVLVTAALFAVNIAITGEWNYQGGDRRTFYSGSGGFPYQSVDRGFDNIGQGRATDRVPVEVLTTGEAIGEVFRHNLVYFFFGRHTGLLPYYFPAIACTALFVLARKQRRTWQWLTIVTAFASAIWLLLYMPFTYSGGGAPLGNRYFLGVYPVFLFITPPLLGTAAGIVTAGISALFTAHLVLNPIGVSVRPAEHPKYGLFRLLPTELTLVNDLPVNVRPERARMPLGGTPPMLGYFLDDNAYNRDGEWFWVRGRSRTEVMLRAPSRIEVHDDAEVARPVRIARMEVQLETGGASPSRVTIDTGAERQVVDVPAGDRRSVTLAMPRGVPYRPFPEFPTNYVYTISIESDGGFIPMFSHDASAPELVRRDPRFLGVNVRLVPQYE